MQKTAVILVFHGSHHDSSANNVFAFTERIQKRLPRLAVSCAFLRGIEPTLENAVEAAIKNGVKNVRIIPLLVAWGIHASRDINDIINGMIYKYSDISFTIDSVLTETSQFEAFITSRILEECS